MESVRACFRSRGGRTAAEMRRAAFRSFGTVLAEARCVLELAAIMQEAPVDSVPTVDFFDKQTSAATREINEAQAELDEPPAGMYS